MSSPENTPAAVSAGDATNDEPPEQFPEEFICCVCIGPIYKPVVIACGHVVCFWCIYHSMDVREESRCPTCRYLFYHFPAICWPLHNVLLNLYPKAYHQSTIKRKAHGASSPPGDHAHRGYKQISTNYLLCSVCKEILCRPIVLNCGHVLCEACIAASNNEPCEACQCPVCQRKHPYKILKVCLALEEFLKQQFPEKYNARMDKLRTCELGNSSTDSTLIPQGASVLSMDEHVCSSGHMIHFQAGCDGCGMCPLIGKRYNCIDCEEQIGFDLCEDCFKRFPNHPGRFNQQHEYGHTFEVIDQQPTSDAITLLTHQPVGNAGP